LIQNTFELSLQRLADIVSDLERQVLVHDNVDFDIVVLPSMVGSALCHVSFCPARSRLGQNTYRVNLGDSRIVRHDKIDQFGDELLRRRLANQKPDMVKCVRGPRDQDQDTNEDSTNGIRIPSYTGTNNRHGQAKSIDNNVIAMVDEEYMHRRIAAEDEAVDT
jgi:hypothetical protein